MQIINWNQSKTSNYDVLNIFEQLLLHLPAICSLLNMSKSFYTLHNLQFPFDFLLRMLRIMCAHFSRASNRRSNSVDRQKNWLSSFWPMCFINLNSVYKGKVGIEMLSLLTGFNIANENIPWRHDQSFLPMLANGLCQCLLSRNNHFKKSLFMSWWLDWSLHSITRLVESYKIAPSEYEFSAQKCHEDIAYATNAEQKIIFIFLLHVSFDFCSVYSFVLANRSFAASVSAW